MYRNHRNTLVLATLAAAAVTSWFFSRDPAEPGLLGENGSAAALGYYLRDAAITVMDVDGGVLYEIEADTIEERPEHDDTVLSRVYVRYSPRADVPWEVSADSGVIPNDARVIELSGTVELSSIPDEGRERTVIRAPRLRFAPDDFLATTDTTVSVILGAERLDAVGMSANLQDDHLELESSVHGQFVR